MASIRKRGKNYQVTVSNGQDLYGRQLIETATFIPDPDKTERQNQKALERFALDFEERVKSGRYLDGEKLTFAAQINGLRNMQISSLKPLPWIYTKCCSPPTLRLYLDT